MPNKCIVPECHSSSKHVKLFLAPYTTKFRWDAWCKVCPFLLKLRPLQLQSARFCPLHFKPEHIEQNRLTSDAIPTQYLDEVTLKGVPFYNRPSINKFHLMNDQLPSTSANIEQNRLTSDAVPTQPLDEFTLKGVPLYNTSSINKFHLVNDQLPSTSSINIEVTLESNTFEQPQPMLSQKDNTSPCIPSSNFLPTTPVRKIAPSITSRIRKLNTLKVRVSLDDTPRKQKLRLQNKIIKSKYRLVELKYQNLKKKFEQKCPKTVQFLKKYKSLHKFGRLLVDLQLRLTGVKAKGRRYTNDEKVFCLSVFKLSPKCYSFLRKYFVLPCKSSLSSLLTNIPLRPGINDFIIQHLADAAIGKSVHERQCTLLFDEMAISKNLHFNFHTGVIEGFEDLGSGKRSSNIADKALVFMLRGMFSAWKIPIAFYFARDGVKTFVLKNIIKEIILAVSNAGFVVRATVSDQGSANVAAIKSLIADTHASLLRNNSIETDNIYYKVDNIDNVVYHIFDVPHLLKCFRNNFQKKDILFEEQRGRWTFLEMLYRVDGTAGRARTTKLTDKHINPQSYDKMKVKFAAQVFSKQVATALDLYMKSLLNLREDHGLSIPGVDIDDGLFTAELLLFINNLFDSLNCHDYSRGPLQQSLTTKSEHLSFWGLAVKKLESMKFDGSDERERNPLCLKNFIHVIKTIRCLWADLIKLEGVKFLSLRRLNQDPLENFFGQIRSQGGFNTNPDCHHFVSAFKTLLINNITTGKSLYTNCATDDDTMLGTLTNLTQRREQSIVASEEHALNCEILDCIPQENILQTQSASYISGAICRALLSKLECGECNACKNALLSNEVQSFHSLIASREYSSEKRSLYYPSQNLSSLVWQSIYLIDKLLPKICNVYIYSDLISALQQNLDITWFNCDVHKNMFFSSFWLYVIRMQVRQWCINFNRRIHKVDSRPKSAEMEDLIAKKVTKGLSYRSVRLRSN